MTNPAIQDPGLAVLLRGVAARDADAFASLHRATRARLMNVAMMTLRDTSQAEEVLQEAFVRVWCNAASFDDAQSTPMTWLIAIVRNKAIDAFRASRVERQVTCVLDDQALQVASSSTCEPTQQAHRSAAVRALDSRLARLRGAERQALSMAYALDMNHQQIAAALGAPLGTVKAWVRRGARKLREQLSADGFAVA